MIRRIRYRDLVLIWNLSDFKPPVSPPGFGAEVRLVDGKIVNPKGFMVVVSSMLAEVAFRPWNDFINEEANIEEFNVLVQVAPSVKSWLQCSHVALGLNKLAISTAEQSLFHESFTKMSINEVPLGFIAIHKFPARGVGIGNSTGSMNLIATDFPDSGTLLDPTQPRRKIDYDFDGRKISSKDVCVQLLKVLFFSLTLDE